jgi:YcaO-like protein with predicted kinase domain
LARVDRSFPAFGITRVADVTGLDRIGIPVARCIRPAARTLSVSQGKGISRELAEISGIMESIELYHAEPVRPPEVVAAYERMRRRYSTLDPTELKPGIRWRAYRPSREIAWIQGTDLSSGDPIFPHASVNLDWTTVLPDFELLSTNSNGLASGNDRWEAICHGLFEVIERDCDWRWHEFSPGERQAPAPGQHDDRLTAPSGAPRPSHQSRRHGEDLGAHVGSRCSGVSVHHQR